MINDLREISDVQFGGNIFSTVLEDIKSRWIIDIKISVIVGIIVSLIMTFLMWKKKYNENLLSQNNNKALAVSRTLLSSVSFFVICSCISSIVCIIIIRFGWLFHKK